MRPTSAEAIAANTGGALRGNPSATADRVVIDTRAALRDGDLFVGLVGPNFDGGAFAAQAFASGASVALVGKHVEVQPPEGCALVSVDDPLAAFHALASVERSAFGGVVVAITGSNGKTTTKDMLAAALGRSRPVYASPMSYNSQVGVALALLNLDPEAEVAVIECGISKPGEMRRLQHIVRPTHGIFVNVGDSHLEGLGTRGVVAAEKARLFAELSADAWCLVPEEERMAIDALEANAAPARTVGNDAFASSLALPVAFLQDARLAVAAARLLGADDESIRAGLSGWEPAPMRMEISSTARGVTLINDAYTADPGSMEAALTALERYPTRGRRLAVLGGMDQLGAVGPAAHAAVGRRVAGSTVDRLVGVGDGGAAIVEGAVAAGFRRDHAVTTEDVRGAARFLEEFVEADDVLLIKASRPQRLERIAPLLFGAVAPARAFVDLDVLVENLHAYKRFVGPGVGVMPVVKSFGYGLGAPRIALELENAGADYFCVAYADEGIELRDHGVVTPILVQNVVPEDASKVVLHGLTAEVATIEQVDLLASAAARAKRPTRVHLKVDTGMGRSGVTPARAAEVARRLDAAEWLDLEGVMTHFAAADESEHDAFTRTQIAEFDAALRAIRGSGLEPRWVHACNSAGAARFPEARHSMVRAGIGLLGYSDAVVDAGLHTHPILRLTTRVVSVKDVPEGGFVGYGMTWKAPQRTRVAIVALGYGDGYPRALSNKGQMRIGGVLCPVIGRVCMDVTMLDVSTVPTAISPGDEVVVWGSEPGDPSLAEHAELAGTIPYELLARLSSRVRRIFRRTH